MKTQRKGQGALEYLMTYGWALLIIVVVGAALYALGVLNPSTYTKSTCAGFSYFSFQDQQLDTTLDNYTLVFYNGNQDVTITGLSVGGVDATALIGNPSLMPSATQRFVISGSPLGTDKTAGAAFNYAVEVTYTTPDSLVKVDKATCTGTAQ